jgi:hypothetical protein
LRVSEVVILIWRWYRSGVVVGFIIAHAELRCFGFSGEIMGSVEERVVFVFMFFEVLFFSLLLRDRIVGELGLS